MSMSKREEFQVFEGRFRDKNVLILGAGSGIGRACAERMLKEGASVVAADRDKDRLDDLEQGSLQWSTRLTTIQTDAGTPEDVEKAVCAALALRDRIDVLVNAVGGSTLIEDPTTAIGDLRFDEWQRLIDFNLNTVFFSCSAVVPHMKRRRAGKIVNVSSLAGRGISTETSAAYAAAKGGVNAFTRKLSLELGPFGINVNAIAPSLTLTERILAKWTARAESERTAVLKSIPLGRVPYAEDQASVICFLASRDADFISGAVIDVAGGQ